MKKITILIVLALLLSVGMVAADGTEWQLCIDMLPPQAPTDMALDGTELSWTHSIDSPECGTMGYYRVYEGSTLLGITENNYFDVGLTSGTFTLVPVDTVGNVGTSAQATLDSNSGGGSTGGGSTGGGSTGGGSTGGGATTQSTGDGNETITTTASSLDGFKKLGDSCTPRWGCTVWSQCEDGLMTRSCTDANECLNAEKPTTVKECGDGLDTDLGSQDQKNRNWLTGAFLGGGSGAVWWLLGFIVVVGGLFLILAVRRKKN